MEALKKYEAELTKLKNDIWSFAELNYKEFKSAAVQKKVLADHGFRITDCLAGLPTSFLAEYGEGGPIIALLGEYDALPHLSQKAVPDPDPVEVDGNGHGCGHCLSAPGAIGAAIAVKEAIDSGETKGTIRYYACPAEEGGFGKGFMVKEHVFDGSEAALFWHPEPVTQVRTCGVKAVYPMDFVFHGKSSYSATTPYLGRSALDAVELMNVSVNYLREHIPEDAKIHYLITHGGDAIHLVPEKASVHYRIRSSEREIMDDVVERVINCAKGAALMTGTTVTVVNHPTADTMLKNFALNDVLWEKMQEAGAPEFDEADEAFARAAVLNFPEDHAAGVKEITQLSGIDVTGKVLSREFLLPDLTRDIKFISGCTDLGDVSQVVPTAEFNVASAPIGSRGHSWSHTGAFGSTLGTKGMLKAAEIMALTTIELMNNKEALDKVKAEFQMRTKGRVHHPLMPECVQPPIFQLEEVYPEGLGL